MYFVKPNPPLDPTLWNFIFADRPFIHSQIVVSSLCTLLFLWRLFVEIFNRYDIKPKVLLTENEQVLFISRSCWFDLLIQLLIVWCPYVIILGVPLLIQEKFPLTPDRILELIYTILHVIFIILVPYYYYKQTSKRVWFTNTRIISFWLIGITKTVEYGEIQHAKAIRQGLNPNRDRFKIVTFQGKTISQFGVGDLYSVTQKTKEYIDWEYPKFTPYDQSKLFKWFVKRYNKMATKADK